MPTATITVFTRASTDREFVPAWKGSAEIRKGTVCVTPILLASAKDQERVIEVMPDGGSVNFAMFDSLPSEPEAQGVAAPGAEPPGMRFAACSGVYAVFPRQVRRAPFAGSLVALCARGTPQPTV